MKEKYIDTNLLIRFFVKDGSKSQVSAAKKLFSKLDSRKIKLRTNILVIAEVCYVLEGVYGNDKKDIAEKLVDFLGYNNLILEEKKEAIKTLKAYAEKNIDFEDAYIYTDMLSRDIEDIYTFDKKHFNKLKGIKVL